MLFIFLENSRLGNCDHSVLEKAGDKRHSGKRGEQGVLGCGLVRSVGKAPHGPCSAPAQSDILVCCHTGQVAELPHRTLASLSLGPPVGLWSSALRKASLPTLVLLSHLSGSSLRKPPPPSPSHALSRRSPDAVSNCFSETQAKSHHLLA